MKIEQIKLENYRGARDLTIELHPRLNVFIGSNGAGKSTVLDATAILLSWLTNRIKTSGASGRPIVENDITNGKSASAIELKATYYDDHFEWYGSWTVAKSRRGHHSEKRSSLSGMNKLIKYLQEQITADSASTNLPLFVYYPINRAVLDIPLRIRSKHDFDSLAAYEGALTSGANFRTFFEWFRDREDLENENFRRNRPSLFNLDATEITVDTQLQAVRNALSVFMPDFKDLTVRRNPLRMEVTKNGETLIIDQLSDGEKCLMAMIGDLARRIAIANPGRENPLTGHGVVIIDEIDLHLHPKWQQDIVPRLLKVFPNCQFLLSTHSPHIITHVKAENLYLLSMTEEGLQLERPHESYGKNVDRVLEDLMGLLTTRPQPVEQAISEIYLAIDAKDFEKARALINKLKEEIGADPELVRADVLATRMELIGR